MKQRLIGFCTSGALALLLLVPTASAAPASATARACDGSNGVYLYDDTNYAGRCVRLTEDVADLSSVGFNNIASSIRVIGDWSPTLYVDQNYSGKSSTFRSDDDNLNNNTVGSNSASSLRVSGGSDFPRENRCNGEDGVYLYEDKNFNGRCLRLTKDSSDLSAFGFNNTTSSARIVGNYTGTLYVNQAYDGAAVAVVGDNSDLSDSAIGENSASSVRVQRGTVDQYQCQGEGIYLYENPNYGGRCLRFAAGDVGDLRAVGFDDTASSLRIVGNYSVILVRDLYLIGPSETFVGDDANLADNRIGDNQVTSLRVVAGGAGGCQGEGVYLYEHPNYGGRCVKFTGDAGDLRTVGFDDAASSLRIVGNWQVILCRDLYLTGASERFIGDDANLADNGIGDNQVTSLRATRR